MAYYCDICGKNSVSQAGTTCGPCFANQLRAARFQQRKKPPSYQCPQCHAPLPSIPASGVCGACQLANLSQRTNRQPSWLTLCPVCLANYDNRLYIDCPHCQKQAQTAKQQQASMVICSSCGARTPVGGPCVFCNTSPHAKQRPLFCTACGVPIVSGSFCMNCGSSRQKPFQSQYQQATPQGGNNVAISCTIYWDDSIGGYAVSCSYKPQFVEFLKLNIPASDRAYHPNNKTWTFHEKYFEVITKAAQATFGAASVNSKKRSANSSNHTPVGTGSSADPLTLAFAKFARLLPHDVLKKAYREAAQVLHPDKDASNAQRMADLNEVWSQIKATLP